MLIFYRKSLEENIEKFVENIKKASKNLDKENQKFIEDIFLEKKDGTKYTYYASYLRATLKQVLLSKKDVKLNDICLSCYGITCRKEVFKNIFRNFKECNKILFF